MEIFQQSQLLWKFFNKLIFLFYVFLIHLVVKFSKKQKILWQFFHKLIFCGIFFKHNIFYENFQTKQKFPKKQIFVEICNAAIFCGNFPTKQIIKETFATRVYTGNFPTKKVLWKCSNKATFLRKFSNKACCCGNFPTKQSFVKICHKGKNFFGNLP